MKKRIKIVIVILFSCIMANIAPKNVSINFTQIFFQWNQIPNAEGYNLFILNSDLGDTTTISTVQNSILQTLEWDTSYLWWACVSEPLSISDCTEIYSFTINPLPNYYPDGINVSIYDPSIYHQGITVMDMESLDFSTALDANGNPIWFTNKEGFNQKFTFTQFLENGNMVGFGPGVGYEIDLNGNIIFQTPDNMSVHHEVRKTNKNTYFLISSISEIQYCPEECNTNLPNEIPWQGDIFREFDSNGNEIWSWNTFDYYELNEYNPYYIEVYTGWGAMDWTHSNSVFYDENSNALFISARNLSRITKIDYTSKEIIWNMGESNYMNDIYFSEDLNFSQQHSAQVLDNGNLLFFDNHRYLDPELSRCIEIAYNEASFTSEIVWEHELPSTLFTGSRGECDRLENGNTLITVGRTGYTLEVTPNNEIAWQLHITDNGIDVTKYRSARIPNLYPVAFSITIDEYTGDINNPYVIPTDNSITTNIYNSGWAEGNFIYTLATNNNIILTDSLYVPSYTNVSFVINTSNVMMYNNLYLDVYPTFAPNKIQSFEIALSSSILFGDMNNDNILNILDVVILANHILSEDLTNSAGDINQDGIQNILDLVILVNTILESE